MRALSDRLPLAVVTGRPREEAECFLRQHAIEDCFSTVVCREDADALKPDPAPVRVALERLGVESAWMLGDTPDDARAARGAGALAIGVLAPGDAPEPAREALDRAGVATTLETTRKLEELLP